MTRRPPPPPAPEDWRAQALCRGRNQDWWFAPKGTIRARLAADICHDCPVAAPCAAEGRRTHSYGRWGEHARLDERSNQTKRERGQWRKMTTGLELCEHVCDGCNYPFRTAAGLAAHQQAKQCGTRRQLEETA